MKTTVANVITIENPTEEIWDYCQNNLVIENPQYYKAQAAGRSVWKIPQQITLCQRKGNKLILPFGCLKDIFPMIRENTIENATQNERIAFDWHNGITLYPYQQNAIEACYGDRNGILVAPCGSGKTVVGLALAAMICGRTLWLTHTADLLKQSMERAKQMFDLPNSAYGTITAGKINAGEIITFATVQTMANISLEEWRDYFTTVIVDEVHHCVGSPTQITRFYKVLSNLSARYKYGLTATPDRADGLSQAMYALIGKKIYEVPKSAVADKTVPVEVFWKNTGYYPQHDVLMPDGTIDYVKVITDVCDDVERNGKIVDEIIGTFGPTLVLTQRVAHCQQLCKMIGTRKRSYHLSADNSKAAREDREKAMKRLNSGMLDVVVATYQLAREGLDCPNLQYLIMACPVKEKNTVIQAVGRVMRVGENKTCGIVIDFHDEFSYFQNMERARKSIYKKM